MLLRAGWKVLFPCKVGFGRSWEKNAALAWHHWNKLRGKDGKVGKGKKEETRKARCRSP